MRIEVLERAAKPEGISFSEVKELLAKAAAAKTHNEAEKEVASSEASEVAVGVTGPVHIHEQAIAQREEQLAELKCEEPVSAQSERAESGKHHQGEIVPSQEPTFDANAIIEKLTIHLDVKSELSRTMEIKMAIIQFSGAINLTPNGLILDEIDDICQIDVTIQKYHCGVRNTSMSLSS